MHRGHALSQSVRQECLTSYSVASDMFSTEHKGDQKHVRKSEKTLQAVQP